MPSSIQQGRVTKPASKRSSQRNSLKSKLAETDKPDNDPTFLPLVERTNALSLEEFISLYIPQEELSLTNAQDKNHPNTQSYKLTISTASSIPESELTACLDLIELTSSTAYADSGLGWSRAKKMKEMRLPDMRYLVLWRHSAGDGEGEFLGFTSFMVTYEDGREVIYCYEIHLVEGARGLGLGEWLMRVVVGIGGRVGLEKVMLTVFRSNGQAVRFYERLGFGEDEFSPKPRRLRNGMVKEANYRILSKGLRD